MYVYTTTNPCLCNPSIPNDPPCPEDCNCLHLCSITINAYSDEAVGPCAAVGSIDVSDEQYGHDLCACGDDPGYWSIEDYDKDIFINVTTTTAGVLTWTTKGPESLDKQYGAITMKFCCGRLAAYMCVIIGVKDLCKCPDCSACQECDPCTGLCLDGDINMKITSTANSSNTSITS